MLSNKQQVEQITLYHPLYFDKQGVPGSYLSLKCLNNHPIHVME
jgi:hypothetical protein